ncbi:MAG: hypothetical protein ACXVFN_07035 [Solirubrobacteraceae bacterium]
MSLSRLVASAKDPAAGWDARLWRRWALYTALGYTVVLATWWLLTGLGLDGLRLAADFKFVGSLAIAGTGALLYGGVVGALQWRVLRERVPMRRRAWVSAAVLPATLVWAITVVPAAIDASSSGKDVRVAYLLVVGQALALGPVIGFTQARALRPYTRRWTWWIAGNFASWLIVYAVFFLLSLVIGGFDFAHGKGTPLEAYVMLIASAPLSGRWLLWVTAPSALAGAGVTSANEAPRRPSEPRRAAAAPGRRPTTASRDRPR